MNEAKYGKSTMEILFNTSTTVLDEDGNAPEYHQFNTLKQISVMYKNTIIGKISSNLIEVSVCLFKMYLYVCYSLYKAYC